MVKVIFDISKDERDQLLKLFDPDANINTGYSDKEINNMCNLVIKDYLFENKVFYRNLDNRK